MIMVKAHAKINLALNVNEKMENGYHNVDMVMLPLDLHDRIEFEILPDDYENTITCDDISIPCDESNLVIKALNVLEKHLKINKKFRIHVHKIIPLSAGLGGGSADAAVVVNTILKMLKIKLPEEELLEIAKEIGADVPYCLFNKPARCKGIGEKLEFINVKNHYSVLIVKPKKGVSTSMSYNAYDNLKEKEYSDIEALIKGLEMGNDELVAENMKNGLEKASMSLLDDIKIVKDKLIEDGFKMVLMSGSGSAVFALSKDIKALQHEALKFDLSKYYVKLTSTLK